MFEQIIKASKGKKIVMFLDYDGTLSPIVDDPDRAFMSDAVSIYSYHSNLRKHTHITDIDVSFPLLLLIR